MADSRPLTPEVVKKVLILYVGGTIGMKKKDGIYKPAPNYMKERLRSNPTLHDENGVDDIDKDVLCLPSPDDTRVTYRIHESKELIDSSNVNHEVWKQIARDVGSNYGDVQGFVIIHGTDTMSHTASHLSFMLENLGKPVILTGSQIPLSEPRSDGWGNIYGAVYIAGKYKNPEVAVYFHNKLYRGNRCVKVSSDRFGAFDSPNMAPLLDMETVDINDRDLERIIRQPAENSRFRVNREMDNNVCVLRLFPSITAATVRAILQEPTAGVVFETYGAGNCPNNRPDLIEAIREASARGVLILNITQCIEGGVAAGTYSTGLELIDDAVVSGGDITPEAALSKMSYVLGQQLTAEESRAELRRNLRGEITTDHLQELL